MNITPLKPLLLIQIKKEESVSGFKLPKEDLDKHGLGIIKAIYDECERLKVGDKVIFKKYKPELVPNTEDLYLCFEVDLLAIYSD